jgi:pimeloyl-ACP methyl ester carboxylesterase
MNAVVDCSEGRFALLSREPRGEPRGTVLYLHGFPDQPETATTMLEALARARFRVFAPFLRGYAPSPREGPFSLEQLTRDARALLDALSPDEPAFVLGHDWGAVITYALCASSPARVRSAVAMSVPHPLRFLRALATPEQLRKSWYMLFFQLPYAPERATRAREHKLIDKLWRDWSPGYTLPRSLRTRVHETFEASGGAPIEYYRAMTRPIGAAIARLRGPLAQRITVPVLHLHGRQDGCIAPASCHGAERYFEGPYRSEILEGAGHFLAQERPDEVAARAARWFEQRRSFVKGQ